MQQNRCNRIERCWRAALNISDTTLFHDNALTINNDISYNE